MQADNQYKILSLDGGGSWALIEVICLQELFGETAKGHDILKKFDLVAGNSGGSMVIAAMAENLGLDEILAIFIDESKRRSVFSRFTSIWSAFYKIAGVGPKYSTKQKLSALQEILPTVSKMPICDLPGFLKKPGHKPTHFFISAFDYNRQRPTFFRSNPESNGISAVLASRLGQQTSSNNPGISIVEAAHASSNAPVNYFNEPAVIKGWDSSFWDGAVAGYNNPVLAATVEAVINGVSPSDIVVLSVGTGLTMLPVHAKCNEDKKDGNGNKFEHDTLGLRLVNKKGFFSDIKTMSTSILAGPPDAASYVAYTILNPHHATHPEVPYDRFIRANPQLQPVLNEDKMWVAPHGLSVVDFTSLKELDMDAVKQSDVTLIRTFCRLWVNNHIPNQPIRLDGELNCIIGQPDFNTVRQMVKKYFHDGHPPLHTEAVHHEARTAVSATA